MKTKVIFSWSGGKDSALALQKILNNNKYEVISLITTVTEGYNRISMHGVSIELLEEQIKSIGLPLYKISIPQQCSDKDYNKSMQKAMDFFLKQDIKTVVFGDIFLEEIRNYRIKQLSQVGMKALFPLWGEKTSNISNEFLEKGFKTIISCVDTRILNQSFSGRIYDKSFLNELPSACDPCGENGEFHSFVYDGPIFSTKILIKTGIKTLRNEYFYYTDIVKLH